MGNAVNEAWSHVVCPGCACVCDDIALQRNDAGSVTFEPHCDLGRTWFQKYAQRCQVTATVEGQPVDPSAAMNRAAEILNSADYLLIYGLSRSWACSESQLTQGRLSRAVKATITVSHRSWLAHSVA